MIGQVDFNQGLYYLNGFPITKNSDFSPCNMLNCAKSDIDTWHYRLGHPARRITEHICKAFPYVQSKCSDVCDVCHLSKQHKLPFCKSDTVSDSCFDLVHLDIWGPISIPSIHGHKYFLTVVDDHSRHTWIFLMQAKSETRKLIQNFIIHIKNQFDKTIKCFRSDNGPEFNCVDIYDTYGITYQKSCVETPQQNSVVERKHQHILNVTRSLLFQSNMPKAYWCYAATHAIHIINRLPTAVLNNKCPYEILYKKPPTFLNLKVFGTLCFASTLDNNRTKLDPRARKCVFLGFKTGIKGYVLLDTLSREIFITRNVIFYENIFPFKAVEQCIQTNGDHHDSDFLLKEGDHSPNNSKDLQQTFLRKNIEDNIETESIPDSVSDISSTNEDNDQPSDNSQGSRDTNLRRSERQRKAPLYLKDYIHQVNNSMKP